MEKVAILLTGNLSAPADGPHIIIEAEAPTHREAALTALDMASQGPYQHIFVLDKDGNIPTVVNVPPA